MKISVLPDALRAALDVAGKPVAPKSNLPALTYVLLDATPDGGLCVTGSDMRIRAWRTVSARVDEAGSVLLPPKTLSDFASSVPGSEEITLTVDAKHKATLRCGAAEIKVPGLNPELFPLGSDFEGAEIDLTPAAPLFSELVESVAHAVAPNASRPVLSGVLVAVKDGRLTMVAADGFRLAIRSTDVDDAPDFSVIVDGKALAAAGRAVEKATSVRLQVDNTAGAILLDSEVGTWSIALIDGQFPDTSRIIPRDTPLSLSVDRSALLGAIRLVEPVAREASNMLRLGVAVDGRLRVWARTQDGDHAAETIVEGELLRGEPITVAYNVTYLRQAVDAFSGAQVTVDIMAVDRPCVVHDGVRSEHMQVVMPMTVK